MDAGSISPDQREIERLRRRYLDLMKRALTHTLYRPMDVRWDEGGFKGSDALRAAAVVELSKEDFDWVKIRADGRDWPRFAQTMVGMKRLDNVEQCLVQVILDKIPGNVIETGVWRGGVAIFMRAILEAYGDPDRVVFAADSFEGLPPPDADAFPADEGSNLHTASALAVTREDVEQNFDLYGLLDDRVRFVEGWFKDTLPTLRDETWSLIRLDGDMYESTIEALTNLYPQLSPGGFLIVDDYKFPPCRKAVEDYRDAHGIRDAIVDIDWLGAYWRRTS